MNLIFGPLKIRIASLLKTCQITLIYRTEILDSHIDQWNSWARNAAKIRTTMSIQRGNNLNDLILTALAPELHFSRALAETGTSVWVIEKKIPQ